MWILASFTHDGEPVAGLSPVIKIRDVDTGVVVISGAPMIDKGDGFYSYDFSAYNPQRDYAIICDSVTLSGVERYTYASSGEYNEVLDSIESTVGIVDIRTTLLRKIQTNRLELFDGDTDNWILYDDDAVTPLLTFSVTDKDGDLIVQCSQSPSKRSGADGLPSGVLSPDIYMRKSVYDPDDDGCVTCAENVSDGIYTSTASGVKYAVDNSHLPCILGTKCVDESNIGHHLVVSYNAFTDRLEYITVSGTTVSYITDLDANPWKVFYSDGVGTVKELSNGSGGTLLTSTGPNSAPAWSSIVGAGTTTVTYDGGSDEITVSGGTGSWAFGVDGTPWDTIGNGEILFFNGTGNVNIVRSAENEITISGSGGAGATEWQFGVNNVPWDIISDGEILYFNGAGSTTVTRSSENVITISGSVVGTSAWQFGVNGAPWDIIGNGEILFFNGSDGVSVTRSAENEITISGSSDYYTKSEVDQLIGQNKSGVEDLSIGDTSTVINFVSPFDSSDYALVISLENTVDALASEYAFTITDKTVNGFTVNYSGKMDSDNYFLNWYATLSGGLPGGDYLTAVIDDTSPELGGDLVLGNHSIVLDTAPSGGVLPGHTYGWSGEISTMAVDWNDNGIGTPLHMKSNGHWQEATAASGTVRMPCTALALEEGTGNKKILWKGIARKTTWAWTPGSIIYISTIDGALSSTQPANTGAIVQAVGIAIASDTIRFDPDLTWIEIE